MFDLGWTELLLIGIVALIVVGPKDLPVMFRKLGQFTGKAKSMAREFSSAMNAAADEAGVNEISKTIKAAANPQKFGVDKLREASGLKSEPKPQAKPGSETAKLSAEREEARRKVAEAGAKSAAERKARAAVGAQATPAAAAPAAPETAAAVTPPKPSPRPKAAAKPAAPAANAAADAAKATTKPVPRTPAKKPAARRPAAKSEGDA